MSQIDAFIKQPVVKTYSKARTRRLTEYSKLIKIHSEGSEAEPSNSMENQKSMKPLNEGDVEISTSKSKTKLLNPDNLEGTSETGNESEENGNCKEYDMVKNVSDQSLALLESKNTKSRKKIGDAVLQDLKVTVTSHRRSMGIAETSVVSSHRSRRATDGPVNIRGKRKFEKDPKKYTDSDSSDVEVPNKKVTMAKNVKTKVNIEKRARNTRKTKTDESSSKCKEENETATSDDNFEVSHDLKKNRRGTSNKTLKTELANINQQSSNEKIKDPSGSIDKRNKRTAKESTKIDQDTAASSSQHVDIIKDNNVTKTPSRRGKIALKPNDEVDRAPSSSSETSTSSNTLNTPKKQKKLADESLLNSAERAKRKLKPKVVFTMLDNPHLESLIRQLGM